MEEDDEENKLLQKLNGPEIPSPSSLSFSPSTSQGDPNITADLLRDPALHHEETEEDKEFARSLEDPGVSLPPAVSSQVLLLFRKISGVPEFRLAKWLAFVRKRSRVFGPSRFPTGTLKATNMFPDFSNDVKREETEPESSGLHSQSSDSALETTLWERLGKAVALDIESSEFSWDKFVFLHHIEHTSSTELSDEELSKPVEVTVNSGGVVFFALFEINQGRDRHSNKGVAVIKISSSRLATQSERLGYEFGKRFGIQTPQARVIHNSTDEWQRIKDDAEKSKSIAFTENDEIGKATSTELLEALELSRWLLLMGYVHGFHDLSGKQFTKSPSKDRWPETASPFSRDNWHGKHSRGNGDGIRSMPLSSKLKEVVKNAKVSPPYRGSFLSCFIYIYYCTL